MPQISHKDIREFKINAAQFTDNQVLSYSTSLSKITNSVSFSQSPLANTLSLRDSNGCVKSASPLSDDDVVTKNYMTTYLSSSLITSLFKDSTTIDFTIDNNDGKVYGSVIGQGSNGSLQLKAATGYLGSSSVMRQDLTNNFMVLEKSSAYNVTSTRGLLTTSTNKNAFLYPEIFLESISNNTSYGASIQTHTFYNLNADSTVAKRAVGSSGNVVQTIFSLENYAATAVSITQKAFALTVLSDSNWSTSNRLCHFELFQNGATVTKIMASNPQGDILLGGSITVGNSLGTALAGSIRWNGINIQGFNGSDWLNLDSTVTRYDGVTITDDITWGLMVKDGGLTVPKINSNSLAVGTVNNDKLTTKGYVDAVSSYTEYVITNVNTFSVTHNKGRFLTPEVWILNVGTGKYEPGAGAVYHSADKNTITIDFSANYTGFVVLRG